MVDNIEIIERTKALEHLTKRDKEMLEQCSNKLGSALCCILRHKPERIGVRMDKQAWVNVKELIEKFNAFYCKKKFYLNLPVLMEIVRTDNKQRYGLKGMGPSLMIRCRQGHSISWVEMDYRIETPPEILYHGTISTYLDSIMDKGILPMNRQKVHLSWDTETAKKVAERRKSKGNPLILQVDAGKMYADGVIFYLADNDVWLTDHVEPQYLTFLETV